MKNFYYALLLIPVLGSANTPEAVYSSDMTAWEKINAGTGNNWINWSDAPDGLFIPMTDAEKALSGCDNGIVCKYDSDNDADAWAISPAITLMADKSYTISLFLRDEGDYWSSESWKLAVAQGATVSDMTSGTSLIDNPEFNNQTLKEYTCTFTPQADGDYHFGLNCYSEADNYGIYATGFTVTPPQSSAITAVEAESAATARYFNLQGIEVANPAPGHLYIIKQGNETKKQILK